MDQIEPGTLAQWFGVAVAVIASMIAVFKDYVDIAQVELSFRPDGDVKIQANTKCPDHPGRSKWLRIRVVNSHSRKIAKSCRAYITSIRRILPNGFRDEFANDCRELKWMHDHSERPDSQNLLPEVRYWIDLAATFDSGNPM